MYINIFMDYNHIYKNHFDYKNNKKKIKTFLIDNYNCRNIDKCNYFKRMKRNYYYDYENGE